MRPSDDLDMIFGMPHVVERLVELCQPKIAVADQKKNRNSQV